MTLVPENSSIPLDINFEKDQITFYDNVYFDRKEGSTTKELAISLSTNNLEDFEKLLMLQGYVYGEHTKPYYISKYKEAFVIAANDRNKIDILWENIPNFVGASLPDDQKWDNFVSLSKGSIDQIGTNEEKVCINIVKSFSGNFFFQKLNEKYENLELVSNVFLLLSSPNRIKFIYSIFSILDEIWANSTINPSIVYLEETIARDDYRWAISNGSHSESNKYLFGHDYFCKNDKGWKYDCSTMNPGSALPTYDHKNFVDQFTVEATDPVISSIDGQDIVLPAFLAQVFMKERNSNYKNDFLSFLYNLIFVTCSILVSQLFSRIQDKSFSVLPSLGKIR